MKLKLSKKAEGFTIIEVLIVLAIAGLILLIVFLAVPALQRNSRNTQRRNDVSGMLGKLQEATNNNNGTVPSGTNEPDILLDKLGFYTGSGTDDWADIDYNMITTGAATIPANINASQVVLRNNLKCNSSGATAFASVPVASPAPVSIGAAATNVVTTAGASYRSVVAIYAVEAGGNNIQVQCVDS